jgi:hypothetical protein
LVVGVRGAVWAGRVRTATAGASIDWRSRTAREGHVWLAGAGADVAEESAPLALWPGAGGGHGRDALLRGHRLLHDGIIRDGVFGRRLLHATGEWRYWIRPASKPWRVAPAIFADVARAGRSTAGFDLRTHVDMGGGVRLAIPGGGAIRVDVASSLRDGGARVSAAFTR